MVETSTAARNRRGFSNGKAKELWPGLWDLMKKHRHNFKVGSVFLASPTSVLKPGHLPTVIAAVVTRTPSLDGVRTLQATQAYDSLFEWFRISPYSSISISPIQVGIPATNLRLLIDCWETKNMMRDQTLFIHCTESLLINIPPADTSPWAGAWTKIKTLNPMFEVMEKP